MSQTNGAQSSMDSVNRLRNGRRKPYGKLKLRHNAQRSRWNVCVQQKIRNKTTGMHNKPETKWAKPRCLVVRYPYTLAVGLACLTTRRSKHPGTRSLQRRITIYGKNMIRHGVG